MPAMTALFSLNVPANDTSRAPSPVAPTISGLAACLAMLENEARALGQDMAAGLIGAACLAVQESAGRLPYPQPARR